MAEPKSGHKMKLYRNTGTVSTPVWDLIDAVGDVSIPDLSMGLAELKTRASNYTKNLATLIQSIAIEFDYKNGMDATTFGGLKDDFLAGTVKEYAVMDGAIATTGSQGLRMPGLIENFPWDQPLESVSSHAVRVAIAHYESPAGTVIDPSWMTVA